LTHCSTKTESSSFCKLYVFIHHNPKAQKRKLFFIAISVPSLCPTLTKILLTLEQSLPSTVSCLQFTLISFKRNFQCFSSTASLESYVCTSVCVYTYVPWCCGQQQRLLRNSLLKASSSQSLAGKTCTAMFTLLDFWTKRFNGRSCIRNLLCQFVGRVFSRVCFRRSGSLGPITVDLSRGSIINRGKSLLQVLKAWQLATCTQDVI